MVGLVVLVVVDVPRSSSMRRACRSAWLRTQDLTLRKRGTLERRDERLGARRRGVGGAWELVQDQRLSAEGPWGEGGEDDSSEVGWMEMEGRGLLSEEECFDGEGRASTLLCAEYTRVIAGTGAAGSSTPCDGVYCARRCSVMVGGGGSSSRFTSCSHGFCL